MIHMSQLKVPARTICKKVPADVVRRGIISSQEKELVIEAAAKSLHIKKENITRLFIDKKSLDARKKDQINFVYRIYMVTDGINEKKTLSRYGKNDVKYIEGNNIDIIENNEILYETPKANNEKIIVVGMGPAGMFAALELAEAGMKPVVIERGSDVDTRQNKVESFWNGGKLDTECNVQFGEGGAGTFSDGKLNTMVKDKSGYNKKVLKTFVRYGAPEEILYLQKPHIGTDKLRDVVKAIRNRITELGGKVLFDTKLENVIYDENGLTEIEITDGRKIKCDKLILATGHSARDTFYMLNDRGVDMEAKPFAVGVRVEHPQEIIGMNQYGELYKSLPVADYKLTYTTKSGRGVYSFCMCPGGYVVNASSENGRLAVNGMSNYLRDSENANSAIVVTISPSDFGGDSPLSGIEFQRKWEEAAYNAAGGMIPVQLLSDFNEGKISTSFGDVKPQTKGGYKFGNVRKAIPDFIGDAISEGMNAFDKRIKGFGRDDALILGIESRTSSPVKILRDESLQSNIKGIYPCGEGAGYAGGITSAAMDGIRVAKEILSGIGTLSTIQ
ncbi:MAG: FAD-dependent oxidoreductase [Lachnospiraceae bacterium]|nr:FAD-dependent oxidoreductase [Lachnospiraceae bacterium]